MDRTSRLIIELYRSARESPIPEFQARTIQSVKSLCRIDSAVHAVGALDPHKGVSFQNIYLHNISEEFVPAHAEVAEEDILVSEAVRRGGRVFVFNERDLMPARRFPRVAAFDAKFELQNTLGQLHFDSATKTVNGLLLWRSKERDRFSEDEHRLGEALLPHVIEASTQNRIIWLNELTADNIARRGVRAIASVRGMLHTHDPLFLGLLTQEWPEWSPPLLPKALMDALGRSSHRNFVGNRITVTVSFVHGMLFLFAKEHTAARTLTPAQRKVAMLIAKGLSYKEAAAELSMAWATVRNHLHAVYVKLGVRNKMALAALFQERRAEDAHRSESAPRHAKRRG